MSFNDLPFMKLLSNKCPVGKVKKHTDNGYNSTVLALTIVFFLLKPDGTDRFQFVQGYSSWDAYLRSMMTDGTWGDHVILHGAANCFDTCIHVISCLPHHRDVIINPQREASGRERLVLGHLHEHHYVSLIPSNLANGN